MTEKKYQVFISSTYKDLKDERENIIKSILEMYHIPIGMEMFSAEDEDQWEIIRRTIEISDYYILILGLRYGSKTSDNISFTQKEYEYALEKKIPILAFILDDNAPLSKDKRDDNLDEINSFRNLVLKNSKMAQFWQNTDELIKNVSISLTKQIMQKPSIGWVRGDKVISEELSKELTKLSKENRELRDIIKELESKIIQKIPKITLSINENNLLLINKEKFNDFKQITVPTKIQFNQIEKHLHMFITDEEIEEYNKNIPNKNIVDNYNKESEKYYKIKNCSLDLLLEICNEGTIKANNIYIDIEFPNEIIIFESHDKFELPENPLPYSPLKRAEAQYEKSLIKEKEKNFLSSNTFELGRPNFDIPHFTPFNENRWTRLDNNKLTIKINNLLHTRCINFDDEYKILPLTFGKHIIKVSIICEEFETEFKQTIELNVDEKHNKE